MKFSKHLCALAEDMRDCIAANRSQDVLFLYRYNLYAWSGGVSLTSEDDGGVSARLAMIDVLTLVGIAAASLRDQLLKEDAASRSAKDG